MLVQIRDRARPIVVAILKSASVSENSRMERRWSMGKACHYPHEKIWQAKLGDSHSDL